MCGIAGFWERGPVRAEHWGPVLAQMTGALAHRGPDDAGAVVDEDAGVALGSRRLAVVDLSPHGHQPMESPDGRFVLAYNGEIYNFGQLRHELESAGVRFRGGSDTEVLLQAAAHWGLRPALERCNGMFALALWDRHRRRLALARDRFGEKPLYYGWAGPTFLFGSELKALRAHPAFVAGVDRDALALYFRHNCVPAPYCIQPGVAKLPPATVAVLDAGDAPGTMPTPEEYWSLRAVAERGLARRPAGPAARRPAPDGDDDAALDELDAVLGAAVSARTHADVDLGAFLSGGIDSSLVVALMQAAHPTKVKTFTIAFDDAGFDEAAEARAVAGHLGTDHHELRVTAADALDVVPRLPEIYDEPFADSSQIPTTVLAALARRTVTVALSGDGGDELFGGYNRYAWARRFWHRVEPVPLPVRRAVAAGLGAVPPAWWDRAFGAAARLAPGPFGLRMPGTKLHKLARVLPAADLHESYVTLASHSTDPAALVPGSSEPPTALGAPEGWPAGAGELDHMMYLDTVTYLPDDILTKVDRATMAASLEGRMPFLDPAVAEFAWGLPPELKVHGGTGKWLLRRLLHRYVPAALVERPKAGFGIPVGDWLRGPLRPWAEDLLDPVGLAAEGILDVAAVRRLWDEHRTGRFDRQFEVWDVLMFQAWLRAQRGPAPARA
ncbi:MAG TPA: asparagine synthase (glutamine-hydrolyzing) [Acidimicrobiales bacterium]|nr:asparagine synthase (glutamine-hydrolyzing) [Acidimicrobiales bacterium]